MKRTPIAIELLKATGFKENTPKSFKGGTIYILPKKGQVIDFGESFAYSSYGSGVRIPVQYMDELERLIGQSL